MGKRLLLTGSLVLPLLFSVLISFSQINSRQLQESRQRILQDGNIASATFSDERQTPDMIIPDRKKAAYTKQNALPALKRLLNARNGIDDLLPVRETGLRDNAEVLQYQQYYKGIKVEHGSYKAFVKNGVVAFYNGAWFSAADNMATQPLLNEAQALAAAKALVGAKKYAWEEVQESLAAATDPKLKAALNEELAGYLPKGEIVYVKDFSARGYATLRLAYKFNIYAAVPLSREWVYVDALSGKILLVDHILKHVNDDKGKPAAPPPSVNATVRTRYGGVQTIKVQQVTGTPVVNPALDPNSGLTMVSSHPTTGSDIGYIPGSTTYVLADDSKGAGIETYDMNGVGGLPVSLPATVYAQAKSFTDVDNNWDSTEHTRGGLYGGANEAENDDIAWDAHWGAGVVYDYWQQKHGRLSFDNKNAKIKSYIHYGPAYDNAFWNGSVMTYGDGSGTAASGFRALTSLDVCGHEIGHGICSFTSDLAYVGESGAMNEGLSDIWAACIEHYAMTRSGSTVPLGKYRSFYIGEQIGTDYDHPLRRMDNPKAQGNPDTYGGVNWINPVCTPTLVNDQCGVHTNSGVLNHWFFLLTAGSLNGTRPAGLGSDPYYFGDSDDELRDGTGTANNGGSYTVNGVGFDMSEKVTYIMETMLTSTATYAEARAVSIQVATALTGDNCSPLVESVTNAWYAVGVGAAFTAPCTSTYGFVYQPGIMVSEGTVTTGCNAQKTIYVPVLLPASSSATVTAGGTATNGTDYTLSATTFTNTAPAATRQDSLAVTIYNDAVVEGTETIQLNIAVTNTGGNPVNTSYLITITDDDVAPVFAADSIVLLNETFTDANTGSPYNMPSGWSELLEIPETDAGDPTTTTGFNHWGVVNNSIGITGKITLVGNLPDGTYNPLSQSRTIIRRNTKVDARGLNNVVLHFDYTVQGEVDVTSPGTDDPANFPVFDYMSVVYSLDGTSWMELPKGFAAVVPTSGTYHATLPSSFNNQEFYFGFRWNNDANAGGPVSVLVDNLSIKAIGVKIESELSDYSQENAVEGNSVYYYSVQDRDIIARIQQQDASTYGCITASIEKAGTGSFILYTSGNNRHTVSDKIVRVTPAANNTSGSYNITLYYTEQEILAAEAATGISRAAFNIYKTSASAYTGASSANTIAVPATYTAIPGVGGSFTASFTTGFSGFAIGAAVAVPLPVTCIDFRGVKTAGGIALQWKVAEELNSKGFDVERSTDGVNYYPVATVAYNASNAGSYTYTDNTAGLQREVYYRLKQTDRDNRFRYMCGIVRFKMDGVPFSMGSIYPNPGADIAYVNISTDKAMQVNVTYINAMGQAIRGQKAYIQPGTTVLQLKHPQLIAGTYLIRFTDGNNALLGTQTYNRQ